MGGRDVKPENLIIVANQALALWQQCATAKEIEIDRQTRYARAHAVAESQPQLPMPKKYPVTFDEFLRLTIGGRYKARRLKIYRDYAIDMIWLSHVHNHQYKNKTAVMSEEEAEKIAEPASLDEVETWIKSDLAAPAPNELIYRLRAGALIDWLKKQPSERGRKAAGKRWNKSEP